MKKGIALLITLIFIMAITLSIGVGLSYTKRSQNTLTEENFLLQSNIILNDVLNLLKNSQDLKLVAKDTTGSAFDLFLAQSEFIPFESSGVAVTLEIHRARAKLNPATILDANQTTPNLSKINLIRQYFAKKGLNDTYVDILLDSIGGIKEDLSYNSEIYNEKEDLFRDYIVSKRHLEELNRFYTNTFSDNALAKIDFDNLFYYAQDKNSSYTIDLNYATKEVWELMLGVDELRAEELASSGGSYTNETPPDLSEDEKAILANFKTTYTPQMFLDVVVEVMQGELSAKITFEYDIANQKGYNFSYEI